MADNAVLRAEHDALDWVGVDSSNLEAVAFVPDFGRLWVRFKPNPGSRFRTYVYLKVPASVYAGLLAAPSKGQYHARHVKGVYGYTPFA